MWRFVSVVCLCLHCYGAPTTCLSADSFGLLTESAKSIAKKMRSNGSLTANETVTSDLLGRSPPVTYTIDFVRQWSSTLGGRKLVSVYANPEERRFFNNDPDRVKCINEIYRFQLEKRDKYWMVTRFPESIGSSTDSRNESFSAPTRAEEIPTLRIRSLSREFIELDKLENLLDFEVTANSESGFTFVFRNDESAMDLVQPIKIRMELDPKNSFLPIRYQEHVKTEREEWVCYVECSWKLEDGIVKSSQFRRKFTTPDTDAPQTVMRADDWRVDYDMTPLAHEDFRLTAFGLPEPVEFQRTGRPWLWLGIVLVGATLLLFGLYRVRNRAQRS